MARAQRVALAPSPVAAEPMRFAPDILKRLGEELIPSIDIGIVELVKNAYDADATECRVMLEGVERPGGVLRVSDDGVGMTLEAIRDGWLVLGRSAKASRARTRLGRVPAGDKGLGRLAALRLGEWVELETRPAAEPGVAYRLRVDWSLFDGVRVVEDVPFDILRERTGGFPGTDLVIGGLARSLGRAELERLARSLVLLNDPFQNKTGFRAVLEGSGFDDLERRVKDAWFDAADYHLRAELKVEGMANVQVQDASGHVRWESKLGPYKAIPAVFELWAYLLEVKSFNPSRGVSLPQVREWLKAVGGVHLYHRGMRIAPYGEPGHDWLDMNLARARSPEERPSTNNAIGRMVVEDRAELLVQKTDRSGFVEDETFKELRRFAQDSLNWMAVERVKARDQQRRNQRRAAPVSLESSRKSVQKVISTLPEDQRASIGAAVDELSAASERQVRALREDMELYRTLATVGVTTSVFAHETDKTVGSVALNAARIEKRGRLLPPEVFDATLKSPLALLQRNARALSAWTALPLSLLQRKKRAQGRVDLNQTIRALLDRLGFFLDESKITLELDLSAEAPSVHGTVANVEAILTNLIVNAIKALQLPRESRDPRRIRVETTCDGATVAIIVSDSGPGVRGISLDEIWRPGQTAFPEGSGLGLTIVRDVAEDMGGRAWAVANGALGGATFGVELPLLREEAR